MNPNHPMTVPFTHDPMSFTYDQMHIQQQMFDPSQTFIHCEQDQYLSSGKPPYHFDNITMIPTDLSVFKPSLKPRPLFCHTVFIGGLPKKITLSDIREVFARCGSINNLRLTAKNIAYVRFHTQESVDNAIYLSGYRMILHVDGEPSTDRDYTGRIFVDYAHDKQDRLLAETYQMQLMYQMRYPFSGGVDPDRPTSPEPVKPYCSSEMNNILENIKGSAGNLTDSLNKVTSWLDRGDCNKTNVNTFYGFIQCVNVHMRRLLTEKDATECELVKLKEKHKTTFDKVIEQMAAYHELFTSAMKQKSWDVFSKAQRKNLQTWHKQEQLTYRKLQEDFTRQYQSTEEMDMSDDDDEPSGKIPRTCDSDLVELVQLRQENRDLASQVDAYRNELDVMKTDLHLNQSEKNAQISSLLQDITDLKKQLKQTEEILEVDSLIPLEKTSVEQVNTDVAIDIKNSESPKDISLSTMENEPLPFVKVIALVSCYLGIHPYGADIESIQSYLERMDVITEKTDLEKILPRYPDIFTSDSTIDAKSSEKRIWKSVLFNRC